ncbi:MAG: chloroplast 1-hydroxy-2-methyl-2-(E)-butenyl-4-diphosphate synthase precursor [Trebouxia sp. A1-2]|nr:MAG: chloroplast 1-hydroxy-2-methyl-2-(E)-butenyl-4-diphosphate synthase precursor [Trebouxia sp. A1-2]
MRLGQAPAAESLCSTSGRFACGTAPLAAAPFSARQIRRARKSTVGPQAVLQATEQATQGSGKKASQNGLLHPQYCESVYKSLRRPTRTIEVGNVKVGSQHPIALQTMTTTDTRNVQGTVDQVKKCADSGADIVRITVQGKQEATACYKIREQLFKDGLHQTFSASLSAGTNVCGLNQDQPVNVSWYDVPLVADIHFQPVVASMVAECFEKIRVNPGNFVDGRKRFDEKVYDDDSQFKQEQEHIREVFTPLVEKCKRLNRAMRIGTNHGSLSARILSYYGDTPRGMVESAFEFANICRDVDYHNFLFSMKASNPLVMVQAYRLLAEEMYSNGWDYPLHLGVTEAGEGEDGRLKSAIGIGSLLMDGLGDTIRVSLTEDPEYELEPCRSFPCPALPFPSLPFPSLPFPLFARSFWQLASLGNQAAQEQWGVDAFDEKHRDTHSFAKRVGRLPEQQENDDVDYRGLLHRDGSVISAVTLQDLEAPEQMYRKLGAKMVVGMPFKDQATSDTLYMPQIPPSSDKTGRRALKRLQEVGVHVMAPANVLVEDPLPHAVAVQPLREVATASQNGGHSLPPGAGRFAVTIDGTETEEEVASLKKSDAVMALLEIAPGVSRVHASRRIFELLQRHQIDISVIHFRSFPEGTSGDDIIMQTGSEVGALLVDGLGDGIAVACPSQDLNFLRNMSFGVLQGSRMRNTKTEFVSCPSCGRTLFDLQEVTDQIRTRTGHLPGVSIAVMGCIVNGPGEMADADFGYVGGAPGKIDLYVGKEVVRRAIPMSGATDELIELIKEHDRWVEPETEESEQEEQRQPVAA